jgi:hypothetical protein
MYTTAVLGFEHLVSVLKSGKRWLVCGIRGLPSQKALPKSGKFLLLREDSEKRRRKRAGKSKMSVLEYSSAPKTSRSLF